MRTFFVLSIAMLLLAACRAMPALPAAAQTAEAAEAPAPVPPPTEELVMLRANPWQWVAFTNPVEAFTVAEPGNYTVTFNTDASVTIVADCNEALGWYQGEGGVLTIEMEPMTAAACPAGSRSEQFVRLLGSAARYFFQEGNLLIDLFADGGTLVFAPVPVSTMAADGEGTVAEQHERLAATLANLTYSGVSGTGPITLTDGVYAYTEPDSAARPFVRLLDRLVVQGDLNGDGAEDAVALLEDNSAGSGRFIFLAPVLNVLTEPMAAPAIMIGDRVQITSLTITGAQVVAELIAQGPGDALCCPTWRVRDVFTLQDHELVESSREELGKVALTDLSGTSWRLVELGGDQTPVLPDTEISARFDGDRISGSAGCNTYTAGVSSPGDSPQSIAVGPIATTKMRCPEPIAHQETAYLARLAEAVRWWYDDGWLAIAYRSDDPAGGRLLLAPSGASA